MKKFEVREDAFDSLFLFVFGVDGQVEYAHAGYEDTPGSLLEDIASLWFGADPARDWDENYEAQSCYDPQTPQALYTQSLITGARLAADNNGVYPSQGTHSETNSAFCISLG